MAKGPAHLGTSGPHPCDGLINRQVDQRRTRRVVGCRSSRATPVLVWRRTATGALGGFRSIGAVAEDLRRWWLPRPL